MASIESRDLNLRQVFEAFYAVPNYQREYVWTDEQVKRLLEDIRNEQTAADNTEYFIGSIVTTPGQHGKFDLIDGQQRITTLFILFCALRDRREALGDTDHQLLDELIADMILDDDGNEAPQVRLDAQYADAGDVLQKLAEGIAPAPDQPTRSMRNMAVAYYTCLEVLEEEFGRDVAALKRFFAYVTGKVKLIRIETDSVARALKIFETINDRGVSLDAMDLLKNLLFMKANQAQYDSLQKDWKALSDNIFASKEKPLRFLRYYVFATYGVKGKREDELYDWLSGDNGPAEIASDPLRFVANLKAGFDAYNNFINGRDIHGVAQPYMESLAYLAGKATRQHLILLLAGRHLPDDAFAALCRDAEQLLFTYIVTRQITREFENLFPDWAKTLRETVLTLDDYQTRLAHEFQNRRSELASSFTRELVAIDWSKMKVAYQRYLVCKLTQAVDLIGFGNDGVPARLGNYTASTNHVEHILPKNAGDRKAQIEAEFGESFDDPALIWSIGNLALAEQAINTSLGNKPFSEKRSVYPSSRWLLTQCVSSKPQVGKNTAVDRAVAPFTPFTRWTPDDVQKRAKMLAQLAANVWDVHPANKDQASIPEHADEQSAK